MSFGKARNHIIHGESSPTLHYDQKDSAYNGPFFWTAERLLREALVVTLGEFGYNELWRSHLYRAIQRTYVEALMRSQTSDQSSANQAAADPSHLT
jgi:hypothetical protein